ncbi:hypothetical protein PAPYR_3739 [Paratrimastix pyriformis]|uniref:Uncharacterized protein n=1 Tax=Paratrimastix pyriformis TaxID=342808 RepID=A0ABQ8URN8_9EUKA|nr:hypothetical protein PAPYR_3739 [Paratrimastix pyriformis]
MRPRYDMRGLPPLLDSAVAHANTALEAYSSLLQSFPTSVPLMRAYGSLLQDLYGDTELSDSLFNQADQLEEEKGGGGGGPGDGETGSVHSGAGMPGAPVRVSSVKHDSIVHAGSLVAPSLGVHSLINSVVSFLVRRHKTSRAAAESSMEAAQDSEGGDARCLPVPVVAWSLFVMHAAVLGLVIMCLLVQYWAVVGTDAMGSVVRGNNNCSALVAALSYESRKLLELSMSPLGVVTGPTTPAAQASAAAVTAKMFELGTRLADTVYATGAQQGLVSQWTTWKNDVVYPVPSNGTLVTMTFDAISLWSYTLEYAGKARQIGLVGATQITEDNLLSDLLYLMLNGPMVLAPALVNISTYSAESMDTASFTLVMAPLWTGLVALLFCAWASVLTMLALRCISKERKAVLAYFFNLPRDTVHKEFLRLQHHREADDGDTASVASGRTPPLSHSTEPPQPARMQPVPVSVTVGGAGRSPSMATRAPASSGPTPLCHMPSSCPVLATVNTMDTEVPLLPGESLVDESTLIPAMAVDHSIDSQLAALLMQDTAPVTSSPLGVGLVDRRLQPAGPAFSSTGSLLTMQSVSRQPTVRFDVQKSLMATSPLDQLVAAGCGNLQQSTIVNLEETQADLNTTAANTTTAADDDEAEVENEAADSEEVSKRRAEEEKTAAREKEKERRLAFMNVITWRARVAQVGIVNNFAYQLIHNRTIQYAPVTIRDPAIDARIRHLMGADLRYPHTKTDREMLRPQTLKALGDLATLSSVINYGGVFGALVIPQSLWQSDERNRLRYSITECWLYDQARCTPGRIVGWPGNGTLNTLVNGYMQAISRLGVLDDETLGPDNVNFQFVDTAFEYDLVDGFDRLCMSFHNSFKDAINSELQMSAASFSLCFLSIFVSYVFLFRFNLIKGELTKTALMRALLPNSTFDGGLGTGVAGVRELDELRETTVQMLNNSRDAISELKPLPEVMEAHEGAVDAMRHLFETEERFMKLYNVPHRKAHLAEHAALLRAYGAPLAAMKADRPEAMEELTAVLRARPMLAHTTKRDTALGRFLVRRGVV